MFAEAAAGTEKYNLFVVTVFFILERKKGTLKYTDSILRHATSLFF